MNDNSGLGWESINKEALRFMNPIPKKVKVQKYGIYSAKSYLFVVDEFDDIRKCWKGVQSEKTCKMIYAAIVKSDVKTEIWMMSCMLCSFIKSY